MRRILGTTVIALAMFITTATYAGSNAGPAALAPHRIAAAVINAGIGDTTTRQAVARLDRDARRHHPDLVVCSSVSMTPGSTWMREKPNPGSPEPSFVGISPSLPDD
jgi:hypothetical protein